MKTIGLIGGMSWESTLEYYRIINQTVKERLGGLHSARCMIYSLDFAEIERMQHQGRWDEAAAVLVDAAQRLERGGAEVLVLCTNTMHKLAGELQAGTSLPLLHIADATAERIRRKNLHKVGLLGTQFTMEEAFYAGRLREKHGLEVLVPAAFEREIVHRVIYDELCLGVVKPDSRARYREIIAGLVADGAQGIILGCTEIEMLVQEEDSPVWLFPTARIHAEAAVEAALS